MSRALADLLPVDHISDLDKIDSQVTAINLEDGICNNPNIPPFDFGRFTNLESIRIGDNSFENMKEFRVQGLQNLTSLAIGDNSFTAEKKRHGDDPTRSFHVLDCPALRVINIGKYSFCDYSGEFELRNLPSLEHLVIGSMTEDSWNFDYANLVLRGTFLFLSLLIQICLLSKLFIWESSHSSGPLPLFLRVRFFRQSIKRRFA